jgi:hypothetical protein
MQIGCRPSRDRAYSDFLMGSRLDAYRRWLEAGLRAGYRVSPAGSIWGLIGEGGLHPTGRHLVLRHHVDTDPGTAAAMWAIDRRLGVASSYSFRLSTMAPQLMAEIAPAGGEASYHYKELATVAKHRGLHGRVEAIAHLGEAQDLFAVNVRRLRAAIGLPMRVVAAHGDFANWRLGIADSALLDVPAFRRDVGVEFETHDEALLARLPRRYTDAPHPRYWPPANPAAAIEAGEPVMSILVHPRHRRADPGLNARDDIRRVVEGVDALPSRTRRRR